MNTVTNIGVGLTTQASNTNWTQQAQQTTILDQVNPRFLRPVILSTNGVQVIANSVNAVGINIGDLIEAAVSVDPHMTWPPNVANQPTDQFVLHSIATSYPVVANGEFETLVPITYQWQVSVDNATTWNTCNNSVNTNFSNFTTNHLNIANVDGVFNYSYRVIAISNAGNTNSNPANLHVLAKHGNTIVAAPNACNFALIVNGFGQPTFSYLWKISTDGGTNYSNVTDAGVYTGSNTNTLAISNSTGLTGNKYKADVNNGAATVTSDVITLTVT